MTKMAEACSHSVADTARWYVVRTHRGEERRAERNLTTLGICTFLPLIAVRRRRSGTDPVEPLFPQYLFARFDPETSLRHVSFARGVQGVVKIGGGLATIDAAAVTLLRRRAGPDGVVTVDQLFRGGERVSIDGGPFTSLTGMFDRYRRGRDRVVVLLTSLGQGRRVEVPLAYLRTVAG